MKKLLEFLEIWFKLSICVWPTYFVVPMLSIESPWILVSVVFGFHTIVAIIIWLNKYEKI